MINIPEGLNGPLFVSYYRLGSKPVCQVHHEPLVFEGGKPILGKKVNLEDPQIARFAVACMNEVICRKSPQEVPLRGPAVGSIWRMRIDIEPFTYWWVMQNLHDHTVIRNSRRRYEMPTEVFLKHMVQVCTIDDYFDDEEDFIVGDRSTLR